MYALILLITCLLGPIPSHATIENGGEVWGWLMPRDRVLERFNQVRKILLPVPEQQLEEALYHIGSYYIPIDSETEICRNHSNYFFESFLKKDFWALTMIDASSKIPAGILDGRMMDLGSYDECIRAEEPEGRFRGQYCLVETEGILPRDLTARLNPESPFLETIRSDLAFAVCVPSSCTARDVKVHMDVALNSVNASAIIHPHSCSTSVPLPYTAAEIVSIFIIIVILVMIVLSTIYDSRCKESDRNGLLAAWSLGANIGQMVDTSTTTAAITYRNGLLAAWSLGANIGQMVNTSTTTAAITYRNGLLAAWSLGANIGQMVDTSTTTAAITYRNGLLAAWSLGANIGQMVDTSTTTAAITYRNGLLAAWSLGANIGQMVNTSTTTAAITYRNGLLAAWSLGANIGQMVNTSTTTAAITYRNGLLAAWSLGANIGQMVNTSTTTAAITYRNGLLAAWSLGANIGQMVDTSTTTAAITYRNGLLAAWSLGANIGQMVNTSTTTAAITCLNGLRVIAMLWVIIGHRTLHLLSFPSLRYRAIPEMIDVLEMAPIENTQLSVEIFFLMSGVLVAYGLFRYLDKGKKFNLVQFYVYRYLRLTPTLAALVLLQATILRRATDGPLWRRMFYDYQHNCQTNWWSTLLYIANYVNPVSMCVPQAWYLCADFQLYVLSPLVLLPLWRRPRVGLTITAVLATLTTVAALINAYTEELKAGGAVTLDRRTEVNNTKDYIITHLRAFSFLLGLALGYLLFLIKKGKIIIKLPTWKLWVGWVVSVFFILFSIFFVNYFLAPSYVYNPIVDTVYHILHRHLLALGFSWIILVCTLGYGGFVDKFLSWRGWIPMARLTYCAYLTHVFIQNSQTNSMRTTTSLHSTYVIYFLFAADTVISFLSAAALYLIVEAPVANITSYFFEGNKKPKNSEDTSNNAPTLPVFKYKSSS
ncbi:nose resistant to fluoxetine protein 6-like [Macrosteles quadrilineatus]|uniref:nose resistant to fluoxetine protein 6-like n=1 Tax=Macrosteles quadrilineatus TaxID=74068 RepID=UPI0023E09FCC|nr:nose resistant to fluoxetine protein 6-like [Macrosteles quadrilineatus]